MNGKIEKWVVAQKKHRLSDKHIQMARELGLNPDKLRKIDNHKQETWKLPLPQFIEKIYFKRFKREEPVTARSLKDIVSDDRAKKENKRAQKEKVKNQDNGCEKTGTEMESVSLSVRLKFYNEKPRPKIKLESGDTSEIILQKEMHIFDEAFELHQKEKVTLSELGFVLKKIHPGYKPRRYGCKTLGEIYEKLDKYELIPVDNLVVKKTRDLIL